MGCNSPKGYWLLVVVNNIGLIFVGLDFVVVEFVVLNMQQQIQNLYIFIVKVTKSIIKLLSIILNEKLDNWQMYNICESKVAKMRFIQIISCPNVIDIKKM